MRPDSGTDPAETVAIVGMSCRYPGAPDVDRYWANLCAGAEPATRFSDRELALAGVPEAVRASPRYVPGRGIVDGADLFDAAFFGMSPREAELTDPQHRVFLECCHEALEDAGLDPARFAGAVGVFAGCAPSSYFLYHLAARPGLLEEMGALPWIGNSEDHLTARVSYKLGLRGPSLSVAAACATSLVAVHLGCQSLLAGESDAVLAGGVSIFLPQRRGYLWEEGGMQSPDGRCRAFDARAAGTFFSDGAGVVVLRRLEDARRDGDHVYALVLGSAVNNNGAGRIGYTAPSVRGQADVLAEALAVAAVPAASVRYVEAHGTGTPLGDPIEVAALSEAYAGAPAGGCLLGSAKTGIGHTDRAAGVAGLIKAALAVERGSIPGTLHFTDANPALGLDRSPFRVSTRREPWPDAPGVPRRAAVSSFGIGGTNAHAVLEGSPGEPAAPSGRSHQPLVLSARDPAALDAACRRLGRWLRERPAADLADVAYTLAVGRTAFEHRRAVAAASAAEASRALLGEAPAAPARHVRSTPAVVMLFAGQGAEFPGMARALYRTEPAFREAVDACLAVAGPELSGTLRAVLTGTARDPHTAASLRRQSVLQPAVFIVDYALARTWSAVGVRPDAVVGHSLGELAAACAAGVFALPDAVRLAAARGELAEALPPGAMLAVRMAGERVAPLLPAGVVVAALNAPESCVLSGPVDAIAEAGRRLQARDVQCRPLPSDRALHTTAIEPMVDRFVAQVAAVPRRPPAVPFYSTVTGDRSDEITDPAYWGRQLLLPVRFRDAVRAVTAEPRDRVLIEVGPGDVLATLAGPSTADRTPLPVRISSLGRRTVPSGAAFAAALGQAWAAGCPIDLGARYRAERRRKVRLPTYPFQRRRHLLDLPTTTPDPAPPPEPAPQPEPAEAGGGAPEPDRAAALLAEIEAATMRVWRDLLGVAEIGPDDSFFTWSDSLGATRLAGRLRQEFAVEFPLSRFYAEPTVRGCVAAIREELADDLATLIGGRDD